LASITGGNPQSTGVNLNLLWVIVKGRGLQGNSTCMQPSTDSQPLIPEKRLQIGTFVHDLRKKDTRMNVIWYDEVSQENR